MLEHTLDPETIIVILPNRHILDRSQAVTYYALHLARTSHKGIGRNASEAVTSLIRGWPQLVSWKKPPSLTMEQIVQLLLTNDPEQQLAAGILAPFTVVTSLQTTYGKWLAAFPDSVSWLEPYQR